MKMENTSNGTIDELYRQQREFFDSCATRPYAFRKAQLQKLKEIIRNHQEDILKALKEDFDKPNFESYVSEVGFLFEEIDVKLKKLKKWMSRKKVKTPITSFPSQSYIYYEPKGICLVIGPWNYPFQLLMAPVVAAMAAGNTVVIKPPEQTPHVSQLVGKIISENFDSRYLAVVQGAGHEVVPALMKRHRFDHVFFTGSIAVGKKIAELAAPHLTPLTLELGGKSPAIVDKSANLKVAARRLAFGKWLNAGQTCVAPDYLLVHDEVKDEFTETLIATLDSFYDRRALESEDYASIIDAKQFDRLKKYLGQGNIVFGGKYDEHALRIEPTLMDGVELEDDIMKEEIFGPLLPILSYSTIAEAKRIIARNPYPLALYIFTHDEEVENNLINEVQFGGGMVNNTIVHLSNPHLPFGGIGTSGFGNYHGKSGFLTFSHQKAIMKTATWFDLDQKYPPYSGLGYKLVKRVMS